MCIRACECVCVHVCVHTHASEFPSIPLCGRGRRLVTLHHEHDQQGALCCRVTCAPPPSAPLGQLEYIFLHF